MQPATFEETYPRHEFSELVRLGIACAVLIRRFLDRRSAVAAGDQDHGAGQAAPVMPMPEELKA